MDRNLYDSPDLSTAVGPTGSAFSTNVSSTPTDATQGTQNLVYGAEGATGGTVDSRTVWVPTLDDDFDPMYGDLGKVSFGTNTASNFADDDDSSSCTASDGGTGTTGITATNPAGHNNSTLCDAEDVVIETSVSFVDGLGYGCDPVKVSYTLTCQWDTRR